MFFVALSPMFYGCVIPLSRLVYRWYMFSCFCSGSSLAMSTPGMQCEREREGVREREREKERKREREKSIPLSHLIYRWFMFSCFQAVVSHWVHRGYVVKRASHTVTQKNKNSTYTQETTLNQVQHSVGGGSIFPPNPFLLNNLNYALYLFLILNYSFLFNYLCMLII